MPRPHTPAAQHVIDTYTCPQCEAEPGHECHTPNGAWTVPHQARWSAGPILGTTPKTPAPDTEKALKGLREKLSRG